MFIEVITPYLMAIVFILAFFSFWIMIQIMSRKFADHHPEFGKAREEGGGCGGGGKCNCHSIKECLHPKKS